MPTDSLQRSARTATLPGIGRDGIALLVSARVLVLGAGGLGSPVIQYLAATGVGTLGIVDFDRVDLTNLQRQVIHSTASVEMLKTASAAAFVRAMTDQVTVVEHPVTLDRDNAIELFSGYDIIVDGTDNFATRYLAADAAAILGKPYVWGSVQQFDGEVTVFWETGGDGAIDYRDLHPVPPPADTVLSCADGGVLGSLCGTIGTWMATEVVKLVTGIGTPLIGRLVHLDALSGDVMTIAVRRADGRVPVTALMDDYPAFCGTAATAGHDRGVSLDALPDLAPFDLVDVREPDEHAAGHLPGDTLVPLAMVVGAPRRPDGRRVVFYCETDARSRVACAAAAAAGDDAYFLLGGYRATLAGSPRR
ncbi:MAG TPA: ThiF family adenylyltransferase [Galbitalea sp.]